MVGQVMQRRSRVFVAAVLFGPACHAPPGYNPDNACPNLAQAYNNAVLEAQECTVGAADQCSVQVPSGFWCNCMTWANGGADTLAAIAAQYDAMGCQRSCNGVCLGPVFLDCLADTTSATGGRCQSPATLNLDSFSDGGQFSVPVGYEVDISLQSIGPDGYGMQVVLSSDAATVVEVIIPAGPVNPAGPAYLYRIKALSPGQVVVQIPHMSGPSDAAPRAYEITLNIS